MRLKPGSIGIGNSSALHRGLAHLIGPAAEAAIPALVAMHNESIIGHYAGDALKEIRGDR
jgi:hypothetical protein